MPIVLLFLTCFSLSANAQFVQKPNLFNQPIKIEKPVSKVPDEKNVVIDQPANKTSTQNIPDSVYITPKFSPSAAPATFEQHEQSRQEQWNDIKEREKQYQAAVDAERKIEAQRPVVIIQQPENPIVSGINAVTGILGAILRK